jgi:hypothetical protein
LLWCDSEDGRNENEKMKIDKEGRGCDFFFVCASAEKLAKNINQIFLMIPFIPSLTLFFFVSCRLLSADGNDGVQKVLDPLSIDPPPREVLFTYRGKGKGGIQTTLPFLRWLFFF